MAGGKNKGIGWNPFKRSQRKQKLSEEGDGDSPLQQSQSDDSSKIDGFSVSSFKHEDSSDNSENAVDLPLPTSSNASIGQSKASSSFAASFDSPFVSTAKVGTDEQSGFGVETFENNNNNNNNNNENQEMIINPRLQALRVDSDTTDLEDFESVCFEPDFSQTIGSPKSTFMLEALTDGKNEESDDDDVFADTLEESEFHDANSPSEYVSQIKEKVHQKNDEYCFGADENSGDYTDNIIPAPPENVPVTTQEISKTTETERKTDQPSPSRANQYRSRIYAKTRKSRPFRSRLRNVLATKSPSNAVVQQQASPVAFAVRSLNVDSPLGILNQRLTTPDTMKNVAVKPKVTTTPRSQKLWAKSMTPRSTKATDENTPCFNEDLRSPQTSHFQKTTESPNIADKQEKITDEPNVDQKDMTQYISPDSSFTDDAESEKLSIEAYTKATKKALLSAVENKKLSDTVDSETVEDEDESTLQGVEVVSSDDDHQTLINELSTASGFVAAADANDVETLFEESTAQNSGVELKSEDYQASLPPPPPPSLPPPASKTKRSAKEKETNSDDEFASEEGEKQENTSLEQQELSSESKQVDATPVVKAVGDKKSTQMEKDLCASTSQTDAGSLKFPSFDNAFFDGSFQSMNECSTDVETDLSFAEFPSIESNISQATDDILAVKTETSTDAFFGGDILKSTSKLRNSFSMTKKRMRLLRNRQKKKSFPVPRHPSNLTDTDESLDTLSEAVKNDSSTDDKDRTAAWVSSIAVDEVGQVELEVVTNYENDIYDVNLSRSKSTQNDAGGEENPRSRSYQTEPSAFKRATNSFSTPKTTNATRGVGRASPRTSNILALLGQPGVPPRPPQIGYTIDAAFQTSACSTLSASSSSDSSCSGSSYSTCSDASGASNSAILTVSEIGIQETAAFANKNSLLGSKSRGSASYSTGLHSSSSDSDDDVFSSIDDTSADDARVLFFQKHAAAGMSLESRSLHEDYTMASRNNSLVDGSVSLSSSVDYSSSDSRSEFDEVEAHIEMAKEWYTKMKSAFLGHNASNEQDGINATESTIDNTVQCEYAGVLGRWKIDINQNK